jgi:hypothetical protein
LFAASQRVSKQGKGEKGFLLDFKTTVYLALLHLPPSYSAVSEDSGIEFRTSAWAVRRTNRLARSHPQGKTDFVLVFSLGSWFMYNHYDPLHTDTEHFRNVIELGIIKRASALPVQ